jgi:predicted TIM-barrel fold metal-dependent hydrolase
MDETGVSKAAVIAIAPFISTALVTDAVARYPDRLIAIGSIEPFKKEALTQIDDFVHSYGIRAIKLHPRLQEINFEHLEILIPIARKCAIHGIPLIVCSFIGGRNLYRARTLELCHELAIASQETKIILAHAGGQRPLDALMVLKANDNVHVDLSFSPLYFSGSSIQKDYEYLLKKADPKRVLFGSDYPELPISASVDWLVDVSRRVNLSPANQDAIFYENASRLFKTL